VRANWPRRSRWPARTSTLKTLAESLRLLVALERQAFGIDDVPDDAFLKAMREGRAGAATR